MACHCCDGFDPTTGRCVHSGGLIRDYKKDLDCFQMLGMYPGDTLPADEMFALIFERVGSTRDVCGYGTGEVTAEEWRKATDRRFTRLDRNGDDRITSDELGPPGDGRGEGRPPRPPR